LTSQDDSSDGQNQIRDGRRDGGFDITESRYPSSYYPDTASIAGQRLSQQPFGRQQGITDYEEEIEDYSHSQITSHSTVFPHFEETGSRYSFAEFQHPSEQLDEQAIRLENENSGQATGTISGIIRNYQDSRVGVAAGSEQDSDYEWKDQPLLSRTDSQHGEDYYRVHGRYPRKHFKSPTRSDTTTDENQSTFSGESLLRSSESNPNLSVNSEGRRLPSRSNEKSSVRPCPIPISQPPMISQNHPGGPPTWAPPDTPDIPRPLFFKDATSRSFSNVGKSYTSTGQLFAVTSPLHRVEQPPSTDWPLKGSQPLPMMGEPNNLTSPHVDREASRSREDTSDLYPDRVDGGVLAVQQAARSIPAMWTRQSSGPTYLRRETQNDSEEESFADMSDDDSAQPRTFRASSGLNTVRNSGTDWETIHNCNSTSGSQPELPLQRRMNYEEPRREVRKHRAKDAGMLNDRLHNMSDTAPGGHTAAAYPRTSGQRQQYLSHSPYAMHENWTRGGSHIVHGINGYRQHHPYIQRPVYVADEDLSPEPNDGIDFNDNLHTRRGFEQPDAARPNFRDSQMSFYYPTTQHAGGYFPPRVSSMPQQHEPAPLPRPIAQVVAEPPEAYLGQRARAWTRSDAPTSSYAGSHGQGSNTRSVDPLVSQNGSTTDIQMAPFRGSRRYSRFPMASSLRNSVRRSVARQTDLQPLRLSPTNARQSVVTDVTTWGGFLGHLRAAGHGNTTPPLVQHPKTATGLMARQTTLRRQESASYLLPYAANPEGQMSGEKHVHRHAYHFSVLVLCISSLFIIFLPLYFWGALDLLIQKYTDGAKQTYPKKLKTIAVAVFSVELSSIFVAALMGGLMGGK
jgi:hypothetical protein